MESELVADCAVRFDRIVLAVPDLDQAIGECAAFFGIAPVRSPDATAEGFAWLPLANTMLELQPRAVAQPHICGLVLARAGSSREPQPIANNRGFELSECDGSVTSCFHDEYTPTPVASTSMTASAILITKVDHLVLQTADADACVALFRDALHIRLALDKSAPQWGGRMLFFRAGKLTLEVIAPEREPPAADFFWGIAYQCADIAETAARLTQRGVQVSAVREGRKPGTRVASVKSHVLGIPTLLIEPANLS